MEKLYQVVSEDDEIVGHKLRDAIDFQRDIYRISALWLTNTKGEVLLAKRALMKDKDPGKWGPAAAGTLEEDETYESNMYKEAEEEIGLAAVDFTLGPKQRFHEPRHSFCQWYRGTTDRPASDFVLQEEEVAEVKWVDPNWLKQDVQRHPENYTPSMSDVVKLFI